VRRFNLLKVTILASRKIQMSPILIAVVVLVVVFIVLALFRGNVGAKPETTATGSDYELKTSLFSPAERSFFGVLESVLPDGVGVLSMVRLGDVFKTRKGLSHSRRTSATNRINRKHVDFLLVRKSDLAPLAGLELDDSSHESEERKRRDNFVDDLFRACNLPLLRVQAQAAYNLAEIRAKIATLLSGT